MTSIVLSPFGYFLIFGLLSLIAVVTACLLGIIDFRWKPPAPPPMGEHRDGEQDVAAVRTFLAKSLQIECQVRYDASTFRVVIPPACPVAEEIILSQLTDRFPRLVFGLEARAQVPSEVA